MSSEKTQYKDIGGQAVMEGVMMQSPSDESIAIAVRRPNGKIMVTCSHREPLSKKHKWMGLPLIRGCVNMVVMLKMGMETLDKSTQMLGVMDEEPSKFEKWLADKLGASIDKVVMAVAMALAVIMSMFLFVARCFLKDIRDLFHAFGTSLHCIVSVLVAGLRFACESAH